MNRSLLDRSASRVFFLLLLFVVGCNHDPGSALRSVDPQAPSIGDAEPLGPEGQTSLRAILEAGSLPDLRWPDFSDYRGDAKKFYDDYGDTLPWVRGRQATPQAQAMIAVLRSAGEKGLSADDYDGPRWAERLANFKLRTQGSHRLGPRAIRCCADGLGYAVHIEPVRWQSESATPRFRG